jgi:predicted RNA methylase
MTDASIPARYLREHAHYTEDLPLWRAIAHNTDGPVLDLGCAAGRVALALAQDGSRVIALDGDPAMLEALARNAEAAGAEVAARITGA